MKVYEYPGLRGLELWHGLAGHATLNQLHADKAAYFAGLDDFLGRLHSGTAETSGGNSLLAAAGFERLLLAGGDAEAASSALRWPHQAVSTGPFGARAGAEAVWREFGWRRPVAIDLGQSRLKVYTPEANIVRERDTALLPFGHHALDAALGRARLRERIGELLPPDCDGVVLALPTAISPSGEAEPSTYPGLSGAIEPIFDPLFSGIPWVVCNDAVLAARGYPPPAGEKTLVLTLGFGVGAAVWY